jgi:hypothetical protein
MESLDQVLGDALENQYVSAGVTLLLVLYAGVAAPRLPRMVKRLFENPVFRVLVLSVIVYKGNKDPKLSLMIAVAFVVSMNILNKEHFKENFAELNNSNTMDNDMSNDTEPTPVDNDTEPTSVDNDATDTPVDNDAEPTSADNDVSTPVDNDDTVTDDVDNVSDNV